MLRLRDGRLVGVVTRKTLVREIVAPGLDPKATTVGEIAEPPHYTIDSDLELDEAFRFLEEQDARARAGRRGRAARRRALARAACSAAWPRTSRRNRRRRARAPASAAGPVRPTSSPMRSYRGKAHVSVPVSRRLSSAASSRCRRRRRVALDRLGQLRRLERGAVEDVALADLERVEAEEAQRFAQDHRAGDDHRRALGLEAGHLAALGERQRGEPLELRLDGRVAEAGARARGRGRTRRGRGRARRAS